MNDDKVGYPSDDLTADDYSNIEDHKIQEERTYHNSLSLLSITNYNQALI